MSCLSTAAMKEPLIDCCEGNMVNSNSCKIIDLDLVKCKKEDVEFAAEYELTFNRNDKAHALVSWFDTLFSDLQNPVTLSTSPFKPYTHWK
jgi:protein arginine N-methyltransferase 1